jgi:hypothetical protein
VTPAALRRVLRDYIRWTLYAAPRGQAAPALVLPRLDQAVVTEADIYTARPGSDDALLDERGLPRPRNVQQVHGVATLGRGPSSHDPVGMQASHADTWRRYVEGELTQQPAVLQFERGAVQALVQRLSPRDQQAIWDIGNRVAKEAAIAHRRSPGAIKLAAKDALDRLLALLYGAVRQ